MSSSPEERIQELHLTLPPAPKPVAVYKTAVKLGNLLFVSGHGPLKADKSMITGRVGQDMTLEQGKEAARQVGLAILATVKDRSARSTRSSGWSRRSAWSTAPPSSPTSRRSSTASRS